ncbi:hypothetical protein [Nocardia rhizosphaerae]|uniref:Uncharacterized protein n=1 Tax=Nocardia rhizosphaerae TaxID=1691571 RepID=A0ABV8L3Y4_9NOCA
MNNTGANTKRPQATRPPNGLPLGRILLAYQRRPQATTPPRSER